MRLAVEVEVPEATVVEVEDVAAAAGAPETTTVEDSGSVEPSEPEHSMV